MRSVATAGGKIQSIVVHSDFPSSSLVYLVATAGGEIQPIVVYRDFSSSNLVYLFHTKVHKGCEEKTKNAPWNVVVRLPMDLTTLQRHRRHLHRHLQIALIPIHIFALFNVGFKVSLLTGLDVTILTEGEDGA